MLDRTSKVLIELLSFAMPIERRSLSIYIYIHPNNHLKYCTYTLPCLHLLLLLACVCVYLRLCER